MMQSDHNFFLTPTIQSPLLMTNSDKNNDFTRPIYG